MATDPVPRANHARYLVVLALGAFTLPLLVRTLEALGAPPTPAGATPLLLAALLLIAVLLDRMRSGLRGTQALDDLPGVLSQAADPEEPGARL